MKVLKYVLVLLVLMGVSTAAQSKDETVIYQWKDSNGVTHFTDSSMQVPEKYRKGSKRGVKPLATIPVYDQKNISGDKMMDDKKADELKK